MKLPDPPLLLITDRHQARLPLVDVVRAALAAGCRWVSVREKDLSEEDQIALALTLLPMARRHGACLTLHGHAALAEGVRQRWRSPAGGQQPGRQPCAAGTGTSHRRLAPHRDRGRGDRSRCRRLCHCRSRVRDAEQARLRARDRPQGTWRRSRASAPVPVLAIGGLNVTRAAEVLAAGPTGIAVMGGVMRASDPGQEMRALLAVVAGSRRP